MNLSPENLKSVYFRVGVLESLLAWIVEVSEDEEGRRMAVGVARSVLKAIKESDEED